MSFPRNEFIQQAEAKGHSDEFITECLNYANRLDSQNLPVIFDVIQLADLLNMNTRGLYHLIDSRSGRYKLFAIRKRNGGKRRIIAPYNDIRQIQLWIKQNILDNVATPNYVTAFEKGRSIVDNAKFHENQQYIKKYDIKDFFESITVRRVCQFFNHLGYDNIVSWILAQLCTVKIDLLRYEYLKARETPDIELFHEFVDKIDFLVQGAPTSPQLANYVCRRMDKRLQGLANKLGCNYSRYADDITFSANDTHRLPKDEVIRQILQSEGFIMKDEKTQFRRKGQQQMVTGLLVDGKVRVPSKYKRDIYRHLHFCLKHGGHSHFKTVSPDLAYGKEWLQGRIYFVYSVEPNEAKKMLGMFDQIDWLR